MVLFYKSLINAQKPELAHFIIGECPTVSLMYPASNIRYIWEECLNDEERGITEYLPPAFFSHLSRDTTEGTYSRQRLVRVDLLFKTEFLVNTC